MALLTALLGAPPLHRGRGVNHDNEDFQAELRLQPLPAGHALLLHYRATLDDGTVVHEEATLLGPDPEGVACLWPVMSELPFVLVHRALHETQAADGALKAVFASGPRDAAETFREEITLELHPDGTIVYAHAWGLPGEAFAPRSSARLSAA